jgi:hypothetical protein
MEILRFEQVPESAPQRKKSSRGFLALGLVAALFGISTAFASSTIEVNTSTNGVITLGQGVTFITACDNSIGVKFNSELNFPTAPTKPYFSLKSIEIGTGTGADLVSADCESTYFKITAYDSSNVVLNLNKLSGFNGVTNARASKASGNSILFQPQSKIALGVKTSEFYRIDYFQGAIDLLDFDISSITVETTDTY